MDIWANQQAEEGTVTTTAEITLTLKSRALEIINDSANDDLQYRFNVNENYASLRPLEVMSMNFITRKIYLNSPSTNAVNYRIRSVG